MKILLRLFIAVVLAVGSLSGLHAWTHGAVTPIDTLLVPIIGDSNTGSGECFNATYDTLSPNSIVQLKHNFTVVTAQEPLDLTSMGTNCGSNIPGVSGDVGSTTKLVQLLVANGHVPAGVVRIVLIPSGWAGTGLNVVGGNANWVPAGSAGCSGLSAQDACGCALDGGGTCSLAAGKGLYGMIAEARSLFPNSKTWFINGIEGANDGGMLAGAWQAAVTLLINDIRSKEPDAATVPVLWTGIPPDRYNHSLGFEVNYTNVLADQANIATYISHSFYIDPTVAPILHSYLDNLFVHYNSGSQRGGTYNFITTGHNTDGTPFVWSSASTYVPTGSFVPQEVVVASDGFIYTCISSNTNNDPTGNAHPTLWAQQWDTTASVAVSDSLAGRQYTALVTQFGF